MDLAIDLPSAQRQVLPVAAQDLRGILGIEPCFQS